MSARSVLKHVLAGGGMPAAEPGEAEPSTPSATTVYMLGTLPPEGKVNSFILGIAFVREEAMHDGRHIFRSADGSCALWHSLPPEKLSGGSWYIGPADAVGQRKGYLRATENTDVPEEITRPWHVYSTDEWHPAPEVQIVSEEAYGSISEAALAHAVRELWFAGKTSDGKDTGNFGVLGYAERLNGRYAYRSVDGGGFGLWWVGGAWFVGEESDIGKRSGFLMAEDGSYLPERVPSGCWKVHSGGGWLDAPAVQVIAPAQ